MADSVAAQESSEAQRISAQSAELDSFLLRTFAAEIKTHSVV
jgi:hypothetical protein